MKVYGRPLPEVDEDAETFEGNAQKARTLCAATDSDAGRRPGWRSPRPVAPGVRPRAMRGGRATLPTTPAAARARRREDRRARFRCVLALAVPDDAPGRMLRDARSLRPAARKARLRSALPSRWRYAELRRHSGGREEPHLHRAAHWRLPASKRADSGVIELPRRQARQE